VTTAPDPWPAGEWRRLLTDAVRDLGELLETLELGIESVELGPAPTAARRFPLRVPRGFIARMRPGDPDDPLLRQVLPVSSEDDAVPGFTADPVGELGLARGDGVLSKYHGRALLVVTGACVVHCRYCFRRHFPYAEHGGHSRDWGSAVDAVAASPDVEEVILSGGDPLVLPDDRLGELASRLASIPHLRRFRVHTRLPVVLPERVDVNLVGWLESSQLPVVIVVHANHPQEIDDDVSRALAVLGAAGVTVLNQAVLLAGVNDSADVLAGLSRKLFDCGVLPYYLHMLDRVAGAAHFEVDEERAIRIMDELRAELPGYLVPRLVREVAGARSKTLLVPRAP
jgi:EF-P beta-lysylation protein EpmB